MDKCERDECAYGALADISATGTREDTGKDFTVYFCSLKCMAIVVGLSDESVEALRSKELEDRAAREEQDTKREKLLN